MPLRLPMLNDMQIRNLSPLTQDSYVLRVSQLAGPFCEVAGVAWAGRCPRLPSLSDAGEEVGPKSIHLTDEIVQPIVIARSMAFCHRLNALAIARADQSRNVQWTHPLRNLVIQAVQERLQPAFEFAFPFRHGQPSKSRPPINH